MTAVRPDATAGPVELELPESARTSVGAAADWLAARRDRLREDLAERGAVLVHGAPVRLPAQAARLRDALIETPTAPGESFGAREDLGRKLFSAIDWPAERVMCPQHEESYSLTVPRVLLLACLRPARTGGETLLSDARTLMRVLPDEITERFRRHGWRMSRTFRERMGLSWRAAFGVADAAELDRRCAREGIGVEWRSGGEVRLTRRRAAVVRHPATGEECWFNHAGFFNEWALDPQEREVLVAAFGSDGLPLNTRAGDGGPLTREDVRRIEDAYEANAVPVAWRAGDLLLVDNIAMANGRRPYTGQRVMVEAMGEPVALPGPPPGG
ncbi:TauD/TfdA family dioxygenase [Allonocardiopsis opalescens]|uniref:TfdA family taurine catabolism dioxygenase TauD n=1 Tax=Allonocardiopsis opalescens TaxID=1144618 RepID=A0A2T0PYH9_9ACTN|nr:TauD/TfdA family dioxygenase [Allonocardiopsis opalescens]PRX96519.1 TfdA family taurine catabolism dioxygenase TauD [Allonocardiopsis opalescens]